MRHFRDVNAAFGSRNVVEMLVRSTPRRLPCTAVASLREAADVPDQGRGVMTAGNQAFPVRRECDRKHPAAVALKSNVRLPASVSTSQTAPSKSPKASVWPSGEKAAALR